MESEECLGSLLRKSNHDLQAKEVEPAREAEKDHVQGCAVQSNAGH